MHQTKQKSMPVSEELRAQLITVTFERESFSAHLRRMNLHDSAATHFVNGIRTIRFAGTWYGTADP